MCTQPKKGVLYKFAADWTTCTVATVKQPAMQVWVCPRSLPWTSKVTFPSLSGSLAVLSSTTPQGGYRKVHLKAIPHALHVIGVSPALARRDCGYCAPLYPIIRNLC